MKKNRDLELKILNDRVKNDWWGRMGHGAPLKDAEGNVLNTRGHPANPNYQVVDWLTHMTDPQVNLSVPDSVKSQKIAAQKYLAQQECAPNRAGNLPEGASPNPVPFNNSCIDLHRNAETIQAMDKQGVPASNTDLDAGASNNQSQMAPV